MVLLLGLWVDVNCHYRAALYCTPGVQPLSLDVSMIPAGADPGFGFGGQVERRRRKNGANSMGVRYGRGVPLSVGGGACAPSPENIFNFGVAKCVFWCILVPEC